LLGERSDAIRDHDAEQMLRALDYAVPEPAAQGSPEIVNRARLLTAASRSARVFELAAPNAKSGSNALLEAGIDQGTAGPGPPALELVGTPNARRHRTFLVSGDTVK